MHVRKKHFLTCSSNLQTESTLEREGMALRGQQSSEWKDISRCSPRKVADTLGLMGVMGLLISIASPPCVSSWSKHLCVCGVESMI